MQIVTNMWSADARCPLMIKQVTIGHTIIIMFITNPSLEKFSAQMLAWVDYKNWKLPCICCFIGWGLLVIWHQQLIHCWKKQLDHVPGGPWSNMRKIDSGCPGLLVPLSDFLFEVVDLFNPNSDSFVVFPTTKIKTPFANPICTPSAFSDCYYHPHHISLSLGPMCHQTSPHAWQDA